MNLGRQFAFLCGIKESKNYFIAKNTADHIYQGSRAIRDLEITQYLDQHVHNTNYNNNWHMQKVFVNEFANWLGLDLKNFDADYSAGTTQSFDSFYFRHRHRRFRCYVGEYFYHLKNWISNNVDWSFIYDNDPLSKGDALVISYPFCDSGDFYDLEDILEICNQLSIPVLIDMAYYCLTETPEVNFNFECIDTVAFSLSKIFPVANYRVGVRYTKKSIFDGQKLHDQINYNNYASCYLGFKLIENFSRDFIHNKYKNKQQEVVKFFGLEKSNSVIFSVGDKDWDIYSRRTLLNEYKLDISSDLFKNRICLNPVFENWNLFREFVNESNTCI